MPTKELCELSCLTLDLQLLWDLFKLQQPRSKVPKVIIRVLIPPLTTEPPTSQEFQKFTSYDQLDKRKDYRADDTRKARPDLQVSSSPPLLLICHEWDLERNKEQG